MNASTIALAVLIASGYIGWGIIAKYTKMTGGWVGMIMGITTTVTVILISNQQLRSEFPPSKAILVLVAASILNGIAVCLYSEKITDPAISAAAFMVTVSVLMAVLTPCFNWLIYGTVPSINHFIGYGLAVFAIFFLSK